jgi:myo-inositol-1(or 4)-monophosphatase
MMAYKQLAIEAAKQAGDLLLELSKQDIKYEMKNAHDIVADGDLQAEKIIIEKIKSQYPDHDILSEEAGKELKKSDFLWIVDPIDGTINFSRHIEEYCISIALSKNGQLILGVIYQPALDKLYVAEKGGGAYLNGEKLSVSSETKLVNSLVATDVSSRLEIRKITFDILKGICGLVRHIRVFGSGALHLARIGEGQLDFYYKPSFNYWDFAAGTIIIQEAGGQVTDFAGNPIQEDSKSIVASNGMLHQVGLRVINEYMSSVGPQSLS